MGHLHGGQDVVLRKLHLSRLICTGGAQTVRVSEKRIVWYGEQVPCRNRDELPRRPSVSDSASPPWDLASCALKWISGAPPCGLRRGRADVDEGKPVLRTCARSFRTGPQEASVSDDTHSGRLT